MVRFGKKQSISSNGYLFECDREGKIIKKATFQEMDFEGVAIDNDYMYVIDESLRKVHRFIKSTLEQDYTWEVISIQEVMTVMTI